MVPGELAAPERGPTLAVGAVIRVQLEGEPAVVLIRRGRPPARGSWSLPGGRVIAGERLEAAVSREVREETGLEVEVERLLEVIELVGPDGAPGAHYVILDYLATLRGPIAALRAGDDADDARVVKVTELPTYGVTEAITRVVRAGFTTPVG